jgi:hypothetical protein
LELSAFGQCESQETDGKRVQESRVSVPDYLLARGTSGGLVMPDEIMKEMWRIKDEFAARFNNDLDAMFRYLKQKGRESGRQYVNLTKRPKKRRPTRTHA